jgi:hypothetical protein
VLTGGEVKCGDRIEVLGETGEGRHSDS